MYVERYDIVLEFNAGNNIWFSFHNKLKCNPAYLNSRVNKRVDYLLTVLLRIEEDMFFSRKLKDLHWKRNKREVKEKTRHESGLAIPKEDINW